MCYQYLSEQETAMIEYKEGQNRIYIPGQEGEADIAEMTFFRTGEHLATIDHTYVNNAYRGQGIAQKLLELAVQKLRAENRKIIPQCDFVAREFERNPAYADVQAET